MLVFLEQSLSNKNTFATTTDPTKASHFRRDDGPIQVIAELAENNEQSCSEPLDVITLNFGNEQTVDNDAPLVAPSLF